MQSSNRVVFNTGITYAKTIATSLIALYSTRLVLNALGVEDFGLYNVVGSIIGMLAFLNAAMSTSTQRFISYNLGTKNLENVSKVFANSVIIHFCIGIFLVIGIEVIGVYFINYQLKIDVSRISAAIYILHFVAASTFITVISVPYDAVINAHENMTFLAVVSIIEAIFKLLVAVSLLYLAGDKLFWYGLLMMFTAIIIRLIKRVYSRRRYKECRANIIKEYDKREIASLTSFAGWNLFGALSAIGRNQGTSVVLNLFFSTTINAAYGIANQVNGQLMFFSSTMLSAIRPQIMKSEGSGERERMIRLALIANKFSFFLFTFFALPLFFEMPFILELWLKNVPAHTVEFCRAIIVLTLLIQLNTGLMTAVQAIGKIKVYQMVAGSIQLLTLPVGYVFLKLGYPPYSILVVSIVLEISSTIFRVYYFHHLTGYSIRAYLKEVIVNSLSSLLPVVMLIYFIRDLFSNHWVELFMVCLISSMSYLLCIYLMGLTKGDKVFMSKLFMSFQKKLGRK